MNSRKAVYLSLGIMAVLGVNAGTGAYLWMYIKREHYVAAIAAGHGVLNVLDYGAACDGATDDTKAFSEALEDGLRNRASIYIPRRTCRVDGALELKSGSVIRSDGAMLLHGKTSGVLLNVVSADDWVIDGPLTLVGNRTKDGQDSQETGLLISGSNRYIVNQVTVRDFRGTGIEITGGKPSRAARGDRGKFAFVSLIDNHVGLSVADGQKYSAEYNLFTLMSFSGNDTAVNMIAGNNIMTTSNVVDNAQGVLLGKGLNDGHGIMSAVNINHNRGFNVKADHVTNGYTFTGCHIYGDSSTSGTVTLSESKDITFSGCVIEPPLQ